MDANLDSILEAMPAGRVRCDTKVTDQRGLILPVGVLRSFALNDDGNSNDSNDKKGKKYQDGTLVTYSALNAYNTVMHAISEDNGVKGKDFSLEDKPYLVLFTKETFDRVYRPPMPGANPLVRAAYELLVASCDDVVVAANGKITIDKDMLEYLNVKKGDKVMIRGGGYGFYIKKGEELNPNKVYLDDNAKILEERLIDLAKKNDIVIRRT